MNPMTLVAELYDYFAQPADRYREKSAPPVAIVIRMEGLVRWISSRLPNMPEHCWRRTETRQKPRQLKRLLLSMP